MWVVQYLNAYSQEWMDLISPTIETEEEAWAELAKATFSWPEYEYRVVKKES